MAALTGNCAGAGLQQNEQLVADDEPAAATSAPVPLEDGLSGIDSFVSICKAHSFESVCGKTWKRC